MKERICKGTSKAKGHGCGKQTKFYKYGLCNECLYNFLYKTEEGKAIVNKVINKVTKPRRDLEKAEKQANDRRKLQNLLISTKEVCHRYIRQRDKFKPCISCDAPWEPQFEAGHYYPTKYSIIRFNENNIHGQCIQCNRYKDGNYYAYDIRLPHRIGEDKYKELVELAKRHNIEHFKWDIEELKAIKERYKKLLKEY